MTRLFTSQLRSGAKQFFKHVFVADICTNELNSPRLQRNFQSDVAHHSCDHAMRIECAALLHVTCHNPQRGVPVDKITIEIDEQSAVSITIESNTQVSASAITTRLNASR